jgi:hypothetical protein
MVGRGGWPSAAKRCRGVKKLIGRQSKVAEAPRGLLFVPLVSDRRPGSDMRERVS